MIGIVNYGLGNVKAIANIYRRLEIPAAIVSTPEALAEATRIILPGVGAFDWAMERLEESGMRRALDLSVSNGTPVLGICVGMQIMARRSEEGSLPGLGWVGGEVKRFDTTRLSNRTHLPHMGWNDVVTHKPTPLFEGLTSDARFYFLHSYYFQPDSGDYVLGTTDYGGEFASSVSAGNVYGVQFHPEKSHRWGIQLLKNFAGM